MKKLDLRARPALMMGYSPQSKRYTLWDDDLKTFIISRDVRFIEEIEKTSIPSRVHNMPHDVDGIPIEEVSNESPHIIDSVERESDVNSEEESTTYSKSNEQDHEPSPNQPSLRRSTRNRKQIGEWWIANPASEKKRETALFAGDFVPGSYREATTPENIDFWMPGIKREEEAIQMNGTFTFVNRLPEMNVIPCKYVFKVKNGRPKVRIVAKGFRQTQGRDYFETYAPVVSFPAVRSFLAVVAHYDLECDQMDVVTAFLNVELNETEYMDIPAGFRYEKNANMVCLLHKAVYGLKQAPWQWFFKINSFLTTDLKFQTCSHEPFLYIRHEEQAIVRIVLYVDDLLIAGSN